jgi:hypothetical protein
MKQLANPLSQQAGKGMVIGTNGKQSFAVRKMYRTIGCGFNQCFPKTFFHRLRRFAPIKVKTIKLKITVLSLFLICVNLRNLWTKSFYLFNW